jgi:protein SCO1/2
MRKPCRSRAVGRGESWTISTLVAIGIVAAVLAHGVASADERHPMRGVVVRVDPAAKTMVVSTESVPGFMAAMVMPFTVQAADVLKDVRPGATVEFDFVVAGKTSFAEKIRVRAYENLEQEPLELRRLKFLSRLASGETATKPLALNEDAPRFLLTDQYGKSVDSSGLAGKTVAITFAYLRCPNPSYCFRLASNFGQLQKRFGARLGKDLVLLTIVIDPEHDEKGALAEYARVWTSSPDWHFLTGPIEDIRRVAGAFGVEFWKDEGLLVHSFGTAIVDRQGRLAANIEGNQFSAKQLGDLVQNVMDRPRNK